VSYDSLYPLRPDEIQLIERLRAGEQEPGRARVARSFTGRFRDYGLYDGGWALTDGSCANLLDGAVPDFDDRLVRITIEVLYDA
jgi:hypothetical protein